MYEMSSRHTHELEMFYLLIAPFMDFVYHRYQESQNREQKIYDREFAGIVANYE
jgi:hypothetical protein